MKKAGGIKLMYKWGKKYWFSILVLMVLSVLLQWTFSYMPVFLQYTINMLSGSVGESAFPNWFVDVLQRQADVLSVVLYLGVSIVALQFVRSVMRFTTNFLNGKINEDISRDMRRELYLHIQDLPYSYHKNADLGDLIQRCTSDIETSSVFISQKIAEVIHVLATMFFGTYRIGVINPDIMLAVLAFVPVTAIASVIFFNYVNKHFPAIEKQEARVTTVIQENLAGARVVRSFATERYEVDKLDAESSRFRDMVIKFNRANAVFWGFSDFTIWLQYALIITVGIVLSERGAVSAGDVAACILLLGMVIWPIRNLARIISDFGKTIVALKRIDEVLLTPVDYVENGNLTPEITGKIEFKNVKFSYEDGKAVLDDVSFTVEAGETVAVVAKIGGGKTTAVDLLARLLEVQEGEITIDGVNVKDVEKHYLRQNVGLILQNAFLFSKTIRENIAIAKPDATDDEIFAAAKTACIHDDILQLEKGYDTIVGERGATLSGGQKQRIAIARMLLEAKPVVVFDDSLSAVDTKTDRNIRKALTSSDQKVTSIIITHRITTAKEADKIIVLENGRVAQMGKHSELIKTDGLYSKLWKIQSDLEREFLALLAESGLND